VRFIHLEHSSFCRRNYARRSNVKDTKVLHSKYKHFDIKSYYIRKLSLKNVKWCLKASVLKTLTVNVIFNERHDLIAE
jgi:hypothetical protein